MSEGRTEFAPSIPTTEQPKPATIQTFEATARAAQLPGKSSEPGFLSSRKGIVHVTTRPAPDGENEFDHNGEKITLYDLISKKSDETGRHDAQGIMVIRDESGNVEAYRTETTYKYVGFGKYEPVRDEDGMLSNLVKEQPLTEKDFQGAIKTINKAMRAEEIKKSRYGRTSRKMKTLVAAGLTAAAVSVGAQVMTPHDTGNSPAVEQVTYPASSLEAYVEALKRAPGVKKKEKVTDLTSFGKNYSDKDYNNPADLPLTYPDRDSAVVVKVGYDKSTNTLSLNQNIDLGNNNAYHLFAPLVEDPILKTAFDSGLIKEVVIRLRDSSDIEDITGTADKGKLYLFLPQKLDNINYRMMVSHETLHAVGNQIGLSEYNRQLPSPADVEKWKNVCTAIRTIAVNQSQQHTQQISELMKQNSQLFATEYPDPRYQQAFNEIQKALENGDFNKYQPTGENEFTKKITDCKTIGPREAFFELLWSQGIDHAEPRTEAETVLMQKMDKEWAGVISRHTIFSALSEGKYAKAQGGGESGGQAYQDWDELFVSTANLILKEPKNYAQTIKQLSSEQKNAVRALVDTVVNQLDGLIPQDKTAFHIMLRTNYELWKKEMAKT